MEISKAQISKIKLAPGETLFVTIKSDELDVDTVKALRNQFNNVFPNNRVALFAIGTNEDIRFSAVKPTFKKGKKNGK